MGLVEAGWSLEEIREDFPFIDAEGMAGDDFRVVRQVTIGDNSGIGTRYRYCPIPG